VRVDEETNRAIGVALLTRPLTKSRLTDGFDDISQDDSIGDVDRKMLDAPLGLDLVQVVVAPVGVDLPRRKDFIHLERNSCSRQS